MAIKAKGLPKVEMFGKSHTDGHGHGGSKDEGHRSHKHAMQDHKVHDEHIKGEKHEMTHLEHAVKHLEEMHKPEAKHMRKSSKY